MGRCLNYLKCLYADGDDVAGRVVFIAPGVGDASGFVGGDGVVLHEPFDGGFAVDDVLIGYKGNDAQNGAVVVNDGILDAILRDTDYPYSAF